MRDANCTMFVVPAATSQFPRRFMLQVNLKEAALPSLRSSMDFEGRASRRPMPRGLEVSDWNVDSDVRNGVSSSLARYTSTERLASELRADPSRRLSTGNELRPASTTMLRPVNRYDADAMADARSSNGGSTSISSWRASGAFMPSSVRRTERTEDRRVTMAVPPERLQPRSIQDLRRHTSSSSSEYVVVRNSEREESQSVTPSWDRNSRQSRENGVASSTSADSTSGIHRTPPATYFSPHREREARDPATPATVNSDASTDVMSPPFTPSITDTPTTTRSSPSTPPFTPASEETPVRRQYSSVSPAHYAVSEITSDDSVSETDGAIDQTTIRSTESTVVSTQLGQTLSSVGHMTSSRPAGTSLQQQREQLYAFRRDMRQVFARVDEMVDMHRDMFKADPMSGMPQFNRATARETASFTSDTFEQLNALRTRFEDLSKTWQPPDEGYSENVSHSGSLTQIERTFETRTRASPVDETSSIDTMRNSSEIASSQSMETIEPPSSTCSRSSSPTSTATAHQRRSVERPTQRPRWEPTLSNLSNDSSSLSSSPRSTSPAPIDQPSFLSTTLPVFRPNAGANSSRVNVFEDFDKRMEEIRASLNSIARERPRLSAPAPSPSSPQPSSTSSWAPSGAANGFRNSPETSSDQDDAPLENNSHASNRIHHHSNCNSNNESRKHREARLRQLLRELRDTDANNDDGSSSSSWG